MTATHSIRNYSIITGAYWGFTLTDGAIRMLVVLYFHQLGYTPLAIASLFLFYEFFGVVTNLVGGWLGSRIGLNNTMQLGMLLQIAALLMLTVPAEYLGVIYVMAAQALSGVAKDLNKMSAKASVKFLMPATGDGRESSHRLFKLIAILTGSKNTLKGAGFFLGGLLLATLGFQDALFLLAISLFFVFILVHFLLPKEIGKAKKKTTFTQIFSNSSAINWLSASRFFLFGSRDVWFVVGLPLFLSSTLGWSFEKVGSFLALWIIGYGLIQAAAPKLIRKLHSGQGPDGRTALIIVLMLLFVPSGIAFMLYRGYDAATVVIVGLSVFAIVFAINSALHSFLIVHWSDVDKVSMNVGFYYMANASGRLVGTILSGLTYQYYDLLGCLILSALFVSMSVLTSVKLPREA